MGSALQLPRPHAHHVLRLTPTLGGVFSSVSTCAVRSDVLVLQLDVGVKGKAPGDETAAHIGALNSQLRVIGACLHCACTLGSSAPLSSASCPRACHTPAARCGWPS